MIYDLVCKDASNLGGPMGMEHTTRLWSKLFNTKEEAMAYAEDWVKKRPNHPMNGRSWDWGEPHSSGAEGIDAIAHSFTVYPREVS